MHHIGSAWYRRSFTLTSKDIDKKILILFEGTMSKPEVYLNGKKIGEWKYGYSYFYFDISKTSLLGKNVLAVILNNKEYSSRWYPGAGLYRNNGITCHTATL